MYLVKRVRKGEISGRNLSRDDRRACVAYFTAEGYTVHEVAVVMNVCERTINRDRVAIRRENALAPSERLGDEIPAELRRHAEMALAKLNRAVRDTSEGSKVCPRDRIRAAFHGFYIYNRLVHTLLKARYIKTG